MKSKKIVINNPNGLDLDLAGIVCKKAVQYKSLITFAYRDGTANAKSVLSVLGSCVRGGDEIELFCDGVDEDEAIAAITALLTRGSEVLIQGCCVRMALFHPYTTSLFIIFLRCFLRLFINW